MKKITINLLSPNDIKTYNKVLFFLLFNTASPYAKEPYFQTNKTYSVTLDSEKYEVKFEQQLLKRENIEKNQIKFDFMQEPIPLTQLERKMYPYSHRRDYIGGGTFKQIFKYDGSLCLKNGLVTCVLNSKQKKHPKIISVQFATKSTPLKAIKKESSINQKIRYLHAKDITIFSPKKNNPHNEDTILQVSRFLNGSDLQKAMTQLKKMDMLSKIALSLCLLQKLKLEHDSGIVHNDIKPANIIITFSKNYLFKIYIIDRGFAMEIGEIDSFRGTPKYLSPERAKLLLDSKDPTSIKVDKRSDIYALALILSEIWQEPYMKSIKQSLSLIPNLTVSYFINTIADRDMNYHEPYNSKENSFHENLKHYNETEIKIFTLIYKLLHPNPDKRMTLEHAITEIKDIILSLIELYENKNSNIENNYTETQSSIMIHKN